MIDFALVQTLLPDFGKAALRTLGLVAIAAFGGLAIGFIVNALRVFGGNRLRRVLQAYTAVWRGTPFLAQLFIVYFGLPSAGLSLSPFDAAALTLALYSGAYFAEIFRGCWDAVPAGQRHAAAALGLTRAQTFVSIEMPQALRLSVPLVTHQTVLVLKESALASVITYAELTMTTGRIVAEQFVYLEPYLMLAATYWVLTLAIQGLGRVVHTKVQRRMAGAR
jgi:polar amino acid transport system permease protein